ncbi:hypothetical protein GY45DRAFT_1323565 [Cubamyces sp. BRFM 1775]|nr:hypothetical protein GY45DRAFT_1323565 [Cubamyces sp. BRFM 1775]
MNHTLDSLPAELLYDIVSKFDPETFHQSLLALSRAIPRSPVPQHLLFPRIRLKRGEQVFQLYRRLRNAPEDATLVQEFSFEDWTVDADIFVNLIALMPSLTYLKIFIGPNFAPEHLEEIFQKPRPQLRYLSMRFRPYVQRATYYQFLKGAYFDSTLLALSSWPTSALPVLSIVQDPLDPAIAPTNFAQPLVFFRLDPLSTLGVSPMSNNLKHFRFRVPGRQVARHMHSALHSFPALHLLDLSTCNIGGHDLAQLLGRMRHVQTLVMDGCPIVSQRTDIQLDAGDPFVQWAELGEAIALAGLARATEREKKLKAWTEAFYVRENEEDESKKGKRAKRGRKGLATATISLRAPSPERKAKPNQELPRARVPQRNERIRILPPIPALSSLATSFPGVLTPETYDAVRAEFERGWAAGINRLRLVRARHMTSWHNGVSRVVHFADMGSPEWKEEELYGEEGLVGLVDVKDAATFLLDVVGDENADGPARRGHDCPLLCIAGSKRDGPHVEGCGHRMGWDTYKDEI